MNFRIPRANIFSIYFDAKLEQTMDINILDIVIKTSLWTLFQLISYLFIYYLFFIIKSDKENTKISFASFLKKIEVRFLLIFFVILLPLQSLDNLSSGSSYYPLWYSIYFIPLLLEKAVFFHVLCKACNKQLNGNIFSAGNFISRLKRRLLSYAAIFIIFMPIYVGIDRLQYYIIFLHSTNTPLTSLVDEFVSPKRDPFDILRLLLSALPFCRVLAHAALDYLMLATTALLSPGNTAKSGISRDIEVNYSQKNI
jgi:hypothetical protein